MADVGCGSRMFFSEGFYPSIPHQTQSPGSKISPTGETVSIVRLLCQFSGWLRGGLYFHEFIFICSQFLSSRTVTTDHLEAGGTISKTLPAGRHPLTFQAAAVILLVSAPGEGREKQLRQCWARWGPGRGPPCLQALQFSSSLGLFPP